MIDIFGTTKLNLSELTCHTGGALGSDSYFEKLCLQFNVKVCAYSYKTDSHKSINKVEISDAEYNEGISEIHRANRTLGRYGISKYMNLLARNWIQVKNSKQIFAIGDIISPGAKNSKGFYSKSSYQTVSGGTGYAVQMGVNHNKDIYVFDQIRDSWFRWSAVSMSFIKCVESPKITVQDFAGIGTRELLANGIHAIDGLFSATFITM